MDWLSAVLDNRLTLVASVLLFCGFQVFAFIKGWVLTRWQIAQTLHDAEERVSDYKELWKEERDQKMLVIKQLDKLTEVGETQLRILHAIEKLVPIAPKTGDNRGEVKDAVAPETP